MVFAAGSLQPMSERGPMFERFSLADARYYNEYARSGLRYRVGVNELLGAAGALGGLRVVDMACGTGVLTSALLPRLGARGHVLAVDQSEAMLEVARASALDCRVTFMLVAAEAFGELCPEPVDVICCNAAFWLFDRVRALGSFRDALKVGGRLIFNLGDRALHGRPTAPAGADQRPVLFRRSVLAECVRRAQDRYPEREFPTEASAPTVSPAELRHELSVQGFAVVSTRAVWYAIPLDDELRWLQIEAWSGHSLGFLAPSERRQIIKEVFADLPSNGIFPGRWLTINAQRVR
jgi:SAM-dependent methyltransferase